MDNKKTLLVIFLINLLVSGCGDHTDRKITDTIDVGVVLNAREVATSFNDSQRTRIETTGGVFVVSGVISVFKGKGATVVMYDDGKSYLCIADKKYCRVIRGN